MIRNAFRASPADHPGPSMADPRTIGKWVGGVTREVSEVHSREHIEMSAGNESGEQADPAASGDHGFPRRIKCMLESQDYKDTGT